MKNVLLPYISYNHWANQQLTKALLKLKPEQVDMTWGKAEISVRELVKQLWTFEFSWYQRLLMVEKVVDPSAGFEGDFEGLCSRCLEQSALLENWVNTATVARLDHTVAYTLKKNEHFKTSVRDVLLEVCNGSSLLRGQLIGLLQQIGVTRLPVIAYRSFKPKK
ncbi:DinB family protein [Chitinophaga silvatica]|nr:DinB family protein [Chitinophaga silvatica]